MNIHNFLLDFTGGTLSVAQLLMDARYVSSPVALEICLNPAPLAFCFSRLTHDWSAITGDLAKFGLGSISMLYDVLILVQHYCIYAPRRSSISVS